MIIKNWKMDFMEHRGLSCSAPCDMYSVLFEHGIINDPYYGTNEDELTKLSEYGIIILHHCLHQKISERRNIYLRSRQVRSQIKASKK
jgi:hypothetical protein